MASSSQEPTHQKKGKGKQKVGMVKMESKSNLQVTFSKRRHGLFKKASDLCTLTGSEIGIIVFSPGSKVYSFGNPSIHEIIDKSSLEACHGITTRERSILTPRSDEPNQNLSVAEANLRLSIMERQLEDAKRQMPTMEEREKAELEAHMGIEGMTEEELVELSARLIALKESIARMDKSGLAGLSHVTSLHSTTW